MATTTLKLSSGGQNVSGTAIAGQGKHFTVTTYVPPLLAPDERISVAYGVGVMGTRVFRGGEIVAQLIPPGDPQTPAQASFGTRRGVILGTTSLGVRRPNLLRIKCSLSRYGGCLTGRITLREKPRFDIRYRSLVTVYWRGVAVFTGTVETSDSKNSTKTDSFDIKLDGLKKQFEHVINDETVTGPADLGLVARDLFLLKQGNTDIIYNVSKVNIATGVTTIGDIDFGKFNFVDTMDALAIASGHVWGVDALGEFYFLPFDNTIDRAFIAGSSRLNDFQPFENFEALINSIAIQRQQAKGSGSAGFTVPTVDSRQASINDNGLYHLDFTVPGEFEDALCDEIATRILDDAAELQESAKLKNIPIYVATDVVDFLKSVRVVSSLGQYREVLNPCESLLNFTVLDSSGGFSVSIDSVNFSRGAGSLRMNYTGAGGIIELLLAAPKWENVTRLVFKVRATRAGDVLASYCGLSDYDDSGQIMLPVALENEWLEIGADFGIRPFQRIAFEVVDTGGSGSVWIDEIQMEVFGHKHFTGHVQQIDYDFSKDGDFIAGLELGPPEIGLEDQIKAVKELAEKTNKALEIR